MSNALAIAAVTAVLKSVLDNRLIERGVAQSLGDVSVTALPPDRVSVGADERCQLNLFLYRLTPNTAWRRPRRPGEDGRAADGGAPVPLALDLHYLITAYGEQDFQAEILLGHALQLLHETPVLTRGRIRSALATPNGAGGVLPPARAALAGAELADQVEQIHVAPEFTSTEEMARLWSALQARYRPSAAYKVSAVLLTADGAAPRPPGAGGPGRPARGPAGGARP
jgi:hypothetical protein